jgi:copper(I)-binding protein
MRRLRSVLGIAGAALAAALAVTGCASAGASASIFVASAYVPQPTTPGTTVAYLDIRNNGPADKLVSVQTSVGGQVQLRAPAGEHAGVPAMRTVPDIPIPANSMTRFNPDSFHLLITGAGTMYDGKDIMLRLTFANAGTVTILAMVTNPESGGSSYFLN